MTADTLADRIERIIWERKEMRFAPHNFRHSAATFVSEVAPLQALMIAGVLGHSDLKTAMKHYIKGKQRLSFRLFHGEIDEIMGRHPDS